MKEPLASLRPTQVGAPDPELRNSPFIDEFELDEQVGSQGVELEEGVCYFNGVAYPIGTFVSSGDELLQCCERGVWVRKGELPPKD